MPDDPGEQAPRELQAGIGIDLDQPDLPLAVDQKVIPKNLKCKDVLIPPQLVLRRLNTYLGQLLHSMQSPFVADLPRLQKNLQVAVRKFVARLIFAVILVVFLNCVVG